MYDYYDEEPCRRKRTKVHYEVTNYSDSSCNVNVCVENITTEQAEKLLLDIIDKFGSAVQKELDFKDPRFKIEKPVAGKFPWGEE